SFISILSNYNIHPAAENGYVIFGCGLEERITQWFSLTTRIELWKSYNATIQFVPNLGYGFMNSSFKVQGTK
ncbi:MAG: hypothetical protein KAK04_01415, partial [Cyclobacteriaceae bacterium]|nr:hypothetical protein [Cyclobacteriaceae bacterium]